MSEEQQYEAMQNQISAIRTYSAMRHALRPEKLSEDHWPKMENTSLLEEITPYPRIASGIPELDVHNGGWQGVSLVHGQKGCGKSTLAIGSALYAAEAGHCVVYFEAENSPPLQRKRIMRWYGRDFGERFPKIAAINFHYVRVRKGNDIVQMAQHAQKCAQDFHVGMFLVFDSINAIIRRIMRPRDNQLERISKLLTWLDEVGQDSNGLVTSLCISEKNKENQVKGLEAAYTAWVELSIERAPEVRFDAVRLKLEKDRDAPSPQDLGTFIRDTGTTSFRAWAPQI